MDNPQLLFVAGPNGAGKSTFSKALSNPGAIIFDIDKVNADIEARSQGLSKKQIYQAGTDEFFKLARDAIHKRQDFTLETSFRDEALMEIAAHFKSSGYTANLIYLALESVDQSTHRVNKRISSGGHHVDHRNIQLNYESGLDYLKRFADRFDNLDILVPSEHFGEFTLFLKVENQHLAYLNDKPPTNLESTILAVADLYNNNSRDYNLKR